MRVIAFRTLRDYWESGHPDVMNALRSWYKIASHAEWSSFTDVRGALPSADQIGDRLVFNIGGNKCRVVAVVDYKRHGLLIRFVGTHAEYDRVDVRNV